MVVGQLGVSGLIPLLADIDIFLSHKSGRKYIACLGEQWGKRR